MLNSIHERPKSSIYSIQQQQLAFTQRNRIALKVNSFVGTGNTSISRRNDLVIAHQIRKEDVVKNVP